MQPLHEKTLIRAGFIVKPHGFKGELIVASEISDPQDFPETRFIFLSVEGLPVPFKVLEQRVHAGNLVLRLEDVMTESAARNLNGFEVFLAEEDAELESYEPGFGELEGYRVIDEKSGEIGVIEAVEEYPMQLLARCTYHGNEVLFPLNETIVVHIDADSRTIRTRLPEGLLDVYGE